MIRVLFVPENAQDGNPYSAVDTFPIILGSASEFEDFVAMHFTGPPIYHTLPKGKKVNGFTRYVFGSRTRCVK